MIPLTRRADVDVLKKIPAAPPPSGVTNLDVTAICALISEVSYEGPQNPEVVRWSQGNKHLQVCVEVIISVPCRIFIDVM